MAGYSFLGDHPYLDQNDPLGYDEIVSRLADLILDSAATSPFVVGVEGPWGIGKTSAMGKLQRSLDAKGVKTVLYNAWNHEGKRSGSEALLKTVLGSLDDDIVQRSIRFDRNQKIKRATVALMRVPVVAAAARVGLGSPADRVWDKLVKNVEAANDFNTRFETAITEWAKRHERSHPTGLLVVFIDELDRCSDETVLDVLTTVKLYLTVPGCVFVIGYDRMAISELVHARVATASARQGATYLEKIIQIPFSIPHPMAHTATRCLREYLGTSGLSTLFTGYEDIVVEACDANPRRMKRFINVFLLRWLQQEALPEPAQPKLLALLLLLNLHDRGFSLMVEREFSELSRFLDYLDISRDPLRRSGFTQDVKEKILTSPYTAIANEQDPEQIDATIRSVFPASYPGYSEDRRLCTLARAIVEEAAGIGDEEAARLARSSREAGDETRSSAPHATPQSKYGSVREIMESMAGTFQPEKARGTKATIQFHFTGTEPGNWIVDVENGECAVYEGVAPDANVTINSPSDVWLKITNRELDGATSFMSNQFTFSGDMGVLMQMQNWFAQ